MLYAKGNAWDHTRKFAGNAWDFTQNHGGNALDAMGDFSQDKWQILKEKTPELYDQMKSHSGSLWEKTKDFSKENWSALKEKAPQVWQDLQDHGGNVIDKIREHGGSVWSHLQEDAPNAFEKLHMLSEEHGGNVMDIDDETWNDLRQHAPQVYYELGEARQGHILHYDEFERMPYYAQNDPRLTEWVDHHLYSHDYGLSHQQHEHQHDMQLKHDILSEVKQHLGQNGASKHMELQHKILMEQKKLQDTKNHVMQKQMEWEKERDLRRQQRLDRREALLHKEHALRMHEQQQFTSGLMEGLKGFLNAYSKIKTQKEDANAPAVQATNGAAPVVAPVPPTPPGFVRRMLMKDHDELIAVSKCVSDMSMEVCMEYNYDTNVVSFDLNKLSNSNSYKKEDAHHQVTVYEFELKLGDILGGGKCADIGADVVPYNVCFEGMGDEQNVIVYFSDLHDDTSRLGQLDWKENDGWNEIYEFDAKDHVKKCADVGVVSVCLENKGADMFFAELRL